MHQFLETLGLRHIDDVDTNGCTGLHRCIQACLASALHGDGGGDRSLMPVLAYMAANSHHPSRPAGHWGFSVLYCHSPTSMLVSLSILINYFLVRGGASLLGGLCCVVWSCLAFPSPLPPSSFVVLSNIINSVSVSIFLLHLSAFLSMWCIPIQATAWLSRGGPRSTSLQIMEGCQVRPASPRCCWRIEQTRRLR